MEDQTNSAEAQPTEAEAPAETTKHDPHLSKAIKERDAAKAKARALEESIAAEKTAAKEKAAKDAGKWEEVLNSKDATITKKDDRIAELEGIVKGFQGKEREASLMQQILAEAKADPTEVQAHYLLLAKRNGWEDAPKDVEAAAKERVKALKEHRADLFEEKKKAEQPKSALLGSTKTGTTVGPTIQERQAGINKLLGN